MTTSSCCFSIMPGVVENILKAVSRWPASLDWLAWKRAPSSSSHATPACVSIRSSCCHRDRAGRTFVCVLARELGHGVSNLAPHRRVLLLAEALQHACAYGLALGLVEGQEDVGRLAVGQLARLGRLPPEEDGGECARLGRG